MEVVIAGSHGLIGSALRSHIAEHGHRVRLLVRGAPNGPDEFRWDPRAGTIDESAVAGADVAVNLAGAGVGDHRWTTQYKREILESRTRTTRTLGHVLATVPGAPRTWVQASAIGYYGDLSLIHISEPTRLGMISYAVFCLKKKKKKKKQK